VNSSGSRVSRLATRRRITAAFVGLLVLVLGGWFVRDLAVDQGKAASPEVSQKISPNSSTSDLSSAPLSSLPIQARETWKLIQSNGPFPYPHDDGKVFTNQEKLLPPKNTGYYHEYTVKTPNEPTRGTRRLIMGQAQELYYTGDHYKSFVVVDPGR
jgi:guanyl-specific ribonuclease Sa